ncbi:MAG: endonuclease III [candidate division Zixibacteria bacterium]|nr:endonuclease III [candidate division Zixibacteria bacterium]
MMARESLEDRKKRAVRIVRLLKKRYPDARCTLDFNSVHQLLVATILSAQCTDERVNKVTPALFEKYKTVEDFAAADIGELQKLIYTTGFYTNKARAIKNSARQILNEFKGRIPRQLEELIKLNGVGRKTGSVILGAGYGLAEGIVVDTHVGRISHRLGFTKNEDAIRVEKDLMRIIPRRDWIAYSHMLIDHGRMVCRARRPDCKNCFLNKLCPAAELT